MDRGEDTDGVTEADEADEDVDEVRFFHSLCSLLRLCI